MVVLEGGCARSGIHLGLEVARGLDLGLVVEEVVVVIEGFQQETGNEGKDCPREEEEGEVDGGGHHTSLSCHVTPCLYKLR